LLVAGCWLLVAGCWLLVAGCGGGALKTILVVVFAILLGAILLNRQKVFVRDPLAAVYRNDVKQSSVEVFINYSNDVLMERDSDSGSYWTLIQGWNKAPGTPVVLRCLRWMACLTDADHATTLPIEWSGKGRYDPRVSMTHREVSFVDGDGATVRVTLR
jgi:hypothetical protein